MSGSDTALAVLSRVEELPDGATGALVFGDGRGAGVVFVERCRVCWAAAPGLRRRLTDLLRSSASPPLDGPEAERLFLDCQRQGRPLGEVLVAQGRVTSAALRLALMNHACESLLLEPAWSLEPHWVPHKARGYRSTFTFLPIELLCHANALARGASEVQRLSARLLERASVRDAAVFDRPGEALIACQLPASSAGLRELRAAGVWAAQSLRDSEGGRALRFTADGRGGLWVGWRDESLTWLVHCLDRGDFSTLVRGLHAHGFTSAVKSAVAFGLTQQPTRST